MVIALPLSSSVNADEPISPQLAMRSPKFSSAPELSELALQREALADHFLTLAPQVVGVCEVESI